MQKIFKTITLSSETCFYLMVFLIALHQCASDAASISSVYVHVRLPVMITIIFLFIFQLINMREISSKHVEILVMILFSIYTSFVIGSTWLIYLFLIALFIKEKNFDKIVDLVVKISSIFFLINLIIFLLNYFIGNRDNLAYFVRGGGDVIKRYFVYYNSPNGAARNLIFITAGYTYLHENRVKFVHYFVLLSLTMIVFLFTRSDAVLFVITILILNVFIRKIKYGANILKQMRNVVFVTGMILPLSYIILRVLGFSSPMRFIDSMLTGRLNLSYYSFLKYGFTLFGQKVVLGFQIVKSSLYRLTCDNGYVYCIICYGMLYFGYFLLIIYKIFSYDLTIRDNIMFIVMGLYLIIENRFVDFPTSLPILLAFHRYFNQNFIEPEIGGVYSVKQERI